MAFYLLSSVPNRSSVPSLPRKLFDIAYERGMRFAPPRYAARLSFLHRRRPSRDDDAIERHRYRATTFANIHFRRQMLYTGAYAATVQFRERV